MLNQTPFGVNNPGELFNAFYEVGQELLKNILAHSASPDERKTLKKRWGIQSVADMVDKSAQAIRDAEKQQKLPAPERDESGKRYYSLKRINLIRDYFGTRFKRQPGSKPMILTITNFKGGVAKTTTAVHLAQKCALDGLKVLLVDLDPQATSTTYFGYIPDLHLNDEDTLANALLENPKDIERVVTQTYFDGIDLIPANLGLAGAEIWITLQNVQKQDELEFNKTQPFKRLDVAISLIKDQYDVIILDCAPNQGSLVINAISCANGLLVPLPPSGVNVASFTRFSKTLSQLFSTIHVEHLDYFRILFSKYKTSQANTSLATVLRQAYGSFIATNPMLESTEIDKSANSFSTIYETIPSRSSPSLNRAITSANNVNDEIIDAFKKIWETQSLTNNSNVTEISDGIK